jgi:hypothetical protein
VIHMGGDYIEGMQVCLPQVIKSFQNYRGVATTFFRPLYHVTAQHENHKPTEHCI